MSLTLEVDKARRGVSCLGVTISIGIQKGGVGKTTTTAIASHLLSQHSRVLAVDFDSQGNLTQFLSRRNIYDFSGRSVLEAVKAKDASGFIFRINDRLHLLPAEDILATFSRYLYQEYRGDQSALLRETLAPVRDEYDYILIDLPPNLGDQTINGLTASDHAVVMLQSEPFCYDALDRYLATLQIVQEKTNERLRLAGILISMIDTRTILDTSIADRARMEYEDVVFSSVIRRRSRIKEFTIEGIQQRTKADVEALRPYQLFVEELKHRVE